MSECCKQTSAAASCCNSQGQDIHKNVKEYYGKHLKKSEDLKTPACVTPVCTLPKFIRDTLTDVHEEVTSRYYGCGLVLPELLKNSWILDLGCGSGQDCYMLSKLVGEKGHVTGIDMTDEQIEVAKKYIDYHMQKFGFQQPNVDFVHGYIEKLGDAGLKNNTYDIIVSNCVVNLVPDKKTVLEEAYRVLKDGGEMYFSDVYVNADLPSEIRKNKVLWGECLGGAIWWKDLFKIAEDVGFRTRLVTARYITVNNKELESIVGDYRFVSATFRLFKIPRSRTKERYQVIYNGGIPGHTEEMHFDANFTFKKGEEVEVDVETANILKNSRFVDVLLIQPVKEDLSTTSGGCCPKNSKDIIIDPFILAEQLKAKNPTPIPGGCCGAKDCC